MDGTDALAAIHTAEYFLDLYSFTTQTGETAEFRLLSGKNCGFCNDIIADVELERNSEAAITDNGIERSAGKVYAEGLGSKELSVYFDVTRRSAKTVSRSGEATNFPEATLRVRVFLRVINGRWSVQEVFGEEV